MIDYDYYSFKILHDVISETGQKIFDWCRDNDIKYFTQSIRGVQFSDGTIVLEDSIGADGLVSREIPAPPPLNARWPMPLATETLSKKGCKAVGFALFFSSKDDAILFKLTWADHYDTSNAS